MEKFYQLHSAESVQNTGKEFVLSGTILDCEKLAISEATVTNLNTQEKVFSDSDGTFKIKVRKNDVLLFESESCISQKILVEKQKDIKVSLKAKQNNDDQQINKDLLSPREKEIIFWSAKGLTCQQIADQLFISKRTVETHRKTIMDKTSCLNFIEVVVYGLKERIITLDDL